VTVKSARAMLPRVLEHRRDSMLKCDWPLDLYVIKEFQPGGVLVGCTLIPWEEIERIQPQLEQTGVS
ncbi:MAG TPA: hypothetical protein VFO27_19855, partial [Bryobacteraceae bacterium]|nr:hypothetical protein [Bryobacteraceae bacterium]